jgi:hypothetical protein
MGRSEREKGRKGEAEVAAIFRRHGLEVRGLEATGDHLVVCSAAIALTLHSEVKRQETARVWLWWEQAAGEAPPGVWPLVTFRRSRSPWLSLIATEELAGLLERLQELERQAAAERGPAA